MNRNQLPPADVLIVGGGMAAAWAAIGAARAGARVTLVDKGYVGSSGVTATGGPNHWWVQPDPALRREAVERQAQKAQGIGDPEWMARIIDLTWRHLPTLARFYPFGSDGKGGSYFSGVRGPEYMRALRQQALAVGVSILDHHPAIELLADEEGRVTGARGHALRTGEDWAIAAGAVIMATGGCAFRSGLIGSHCNTGDGYLMAAEAGAELSGMEFSPVYTLSPAWASTRTLPYFAARFFDETGTELDIPPPRAGHAHLQALGKAMLQGPVLADLSDAPLQLRPILHRIQPFTPAPFERRGIDLFRDRFPVKLFGEGTIRGTGGLRIVDAECRTTVAALFAAGDAATRELVAGATSGGGAINSAWALSSGLIAGEAAAREAIGRRHRAPATGLGKLGIAPTGEVRTVERKAIDVLVDDEMHGYDKALRRHGATLTASAQRLEEVWGDLSRHGHAAGRELVALRETAAMTATARWCVAAATEREETRGLHVRTDFPESRRDFATRLLTGGLDRVCTREEKARSGATMETAA
ncbi:succinate dehydrogenase/fumarate reductase flavoprotein subunit [Novosphingobium sp. PhB165]|uniref:FAD-dependent oxidoreductase n=1 Tax=Novosphingobium sp. PhB165 TaxID=2485105 RepID=UPI00104898CD|nr:FAD-binding protein [Novosphingobium sp. PhB165]TCM14207.1 succinate dehydrogenase/fumarate reductase flavoprotein subunit [Novosphingobium sp. PhB165]